MTIVPLAQWDDKADDNQEFISLSHNNISVLEPIWLKVFLVPLSRREENLLFLTGDWVNSRDQIQNTIH